MSENQEIVGELVTEVKFGDVAEFNLITAKIENAKTYLALTITDIKDKEGYEVVKKAHIDVKDMIADSKKTKDKLGMKAKAYLENVSTIQKGIETELLPIRDHLDSERDRIDTEKERIKQEKEMLEEIRFGTRLAKLSSIGFKFNGALYEYADHSINMNSIKTMTDEEFIPFVFMAEEDFKAEKSKEAEEMRLKQVAEAEAVEKKRLADKLAQEEAEELRSAERAKKEEADRAQKEKEALLKVESDRLRKIQDEQGKQARLIQEAQEALDKKSAEFEAKEKFEVDLKEALLKPFIGNRSTEPVNLVPKVITDAIENGSLVYELSAGYAVTDEIPMRPDDNPAEKDFSEIEFYLERIQTIKDQSPRMISISGRNIMQEIVWNLQNACDCAQNEINRYRGV